VAGEAGVVVTELATRAPSTRVRGALVIDGSGAPGRRADVVMAGGRFVHDGGRPADVTIDADGLVAAPGFIDLHTHYDAQIFWDPGLSPSPQHGVTTVIMGNCGFSLAPMAPHHEDYVARMLARVEGMPYAAIANAVPWGWRSYGELLSVVEGRGAAVNVGVMAGHSTIRRLVMGDRAVGETATPVDLEAMAAVLDAALTDGALGFSTSQASTQPDADGQPVPSRWATGSELRALAARVKDHEGTMLQYAPPGDRFNDETLDLMTTMSAVADRPLNWNLLIVGRYDAGYCEHQLSATRVALGAGAVVRGLVRPDPAIFRVTFRNCRTMTAFRDWEELDRPPEERRALLRDRHVRAGLRWRAEAAVRGRVSAELYVRWADYVVGETFSAENAGRRGRRVGDLAAEWRCEPFDALLDIALADDLRTGFYPRADDGGDVGWRERARLCSDPRMIVGGSDAGGHLDMMCGPVYTTTLLCEYPRRDLLKMEECVRLITTVPAQYAGLHNRGSIAPGFHADLVLFDPDAVSTGPFDFVSDLPGGGARVLAEGRGIERVFVNGEQIVVGGRPTAARPGTVLRSGRDTHTFDNKAAAAALMADTPRGAGSRR
jgi:N-acyl-D-aspartate/D-glutamate deacylase